MSGNRKDIACKIFPLGTPELNDFRDSRMMSGKLDFSKTEINQKNIFTLNELSTNQTLVVNISKLTVLL